MYKTFTGGGAGAGVGAGVGVESVSAGVVATICCVVFASFLFFVAALLASAICNLNHSCCN